MEKPIPYVTYWSVFRFAENILNKSLNEMKQKRESNASQLNI